MCRMAVDIKRFSTVQSCRSFAPRDSVPARWPFQKNPVPRGRLTPPGPHTRLLVQTSTGPAQRGLRHLLTALCSTMPTTSSSSSMSVGLSHGPGKVTRPADDQWLGHCQGWQSDATGPYGAGITARFRPQPAHRSRRVFRTVGCLVGLLDPR